MEASGAHGGLAALLERGSSRAEFEAFYLALPLERDRTRIAGLLYDSALLHKRDRAELAELQIKNAELQEELDKEDFDWSDTSEFAPVAVIGGDVARARDPNVILGLSDRRRVLMSTLPAVITQSPGEQRMWPKHLPPTQGLNLQFQLASFLIQTQNVGTLTVLSLGRALVASAALSHVPRAPLPEIAPLTHRPRPWRARRLVRRPV